MSDWTPPPETTPDHAAMLSVLMILGVSTVLVGLIVIGARLWPSTSHISTTSVTGPSALTQIPPSNDPAETQAAAAVGQLKIAQTQAVPTPIPTPFPTMPQTTTPTEKPLPRCQPTLAPGTLCVPTRPQPPAPTPVGTCPAEPTWVDFCAMPDANAGTQSEDRSHDV